MGKTFQGRFDARGQKIAVVASRFNEFITRELLDGALDCLHRHGVAEERSERGHDTVLHEHERNADQKIVSA